MTIGPVQNYFISYAKQEKTSCLAISINNFELPLSISFLGIKIKFSSITKEIQLKIKSLAFYKLYDKLLTTFNVELAMTNSAVILKRHS